MTSSGQIRLKKIWAMLKKCAPGHKRTEQNHNWRITYKDRIYYRFPLGRHGNKKGAEIKTGHVRELA